MQQQGFEVSDESSTRRHFRILLFQPIIIGSFVLIAILTQERWIFFLSGILLWFNTILPQANPFERFYDATTGRRKKYPPLPPAPPPRRFMQGMSGTLMVLAGIFIAQGWLILAAITQVLIAMAFSALLFGKFCVGAYLYHCLTGNARFANTTSPWSR